jgi:hypothetical protein
VPPRGFDDPLRFDVCGVRDSPLVARIVEDTFRGIAGVTAVKVDPASGSVLVEYEPPAASTLLGHGPGDGVGAATPTPSTPPVPTPGRALGDRLVETAVALLLEMALQRLLGPFILPRRC